MNRLVTALVTLCILSLFSCNDADLTAPDLEESSFVLGKGGKPGGDFTNWAYVGVGNGAVVLASFDGSIRKTLSRGGGNPYRNAVRYSPHFTDDGSEVIYGLQNELRIVGVDGTNDRVVFDFSSFGYGPWYGRFDTLPGSSKIIYDGYADIAVVDFVTGDAQRLGWPSFMPGGWCGSCIGEVSAGPDLKPEEVGFQGPIALGWIQLEGSVADYDIYVVMATEDETGNVTLDPSTIVRYALPDHPDGGGQNHPAFSADGTRIAFLDKAYCCTGQELKVVDFNVSAWNAGDRSASLLFNPHDPAPIASREITPSLSLIDRQPAWSPDGSWVAYSGIFSVNNSSQGRMVIIDPDYSPGDPDPFYLSDKAPNLHPDWNPLWDPTL